MRIRQIFRVDIGSAFQQQLDHFAIVIDHGNVQRAPSVLTAAIGVRLGRRQQLLHQSIIPLLYGDAELFILSLSLPTTPRSTLFDHVPSAVRVIVRDDFSVFIAETLQSLFPPKNDQKSPEISKLLID